ncbi:MAG: hypothetical protein H6822_25305 [Planctomycetaceae bacterium]|nr:hypothetical protein [Planctomycetales bacterium]MCB9925492.1 hypothetical protein [Planctomycetaceae bacterium]
MPIQFACPGCGKDYNVKDELAGKKAKCKCGAVMPIPDPAAAAVIETDPLFADAPAGDDLFGNDLFGESLPTGAAAQNGGSLFDEEFPSAGPMPTAPNPYQQAPLQMAPVPQASSYAVAVPTVGPIENRVTESDSTSGGAAFLIGVGLSGAGALLGAVVWAIIAIVTGFEIGWIAWGVGFGSGAGMAYAHHLSDAIDDFLGGVIAATMATLGIVAGKYAVYQFVVLAAIGELGELAELLEDEITFGMMFGPMDALFFFLAIGTAYKLGSGGDPDD